MADHLDDDDTEEEEDFEYDYDLSLLGEDQFEDTEALREIRAKHPDWHIVKMIGFTHRQLADTEEWCRDNLHHPYEKFGYRTGCSYMVGVAFASVKDAIFFKLRWR